MYRQDDGSETIALRDVNLSISAGERVAIVGPNGSGKSTLALVISGLIHPTKGVVKFNGSFANAPTGAMVFQSPDDNLIGETVYDELRFCLEQHVEWKDLEAETDNVIFRFGLDALADRPTTQLSGGEKQIVAVACAMVSRQSLIILDEPTSHLDLPGKKLLSRFLDDACKDSERAPAIIVVTQYRTEVGRFDRLIAMDSGKIIHDGRPSELIASSAVSAGAIDIPVSSQRSPFLSVGRLSQVQTPGWGLSEHPIRNISLDIRQGEAIALCGPSGAGKTTLALLLSGLISKFDGERRLQSDPPVMLMQFPERQIFCNTVEEEVSYGLIARGIRRDDATSRSHDALRQVGLLPDDFAKRNPFSLSGGQKRRVMLAAAAVLDAPLYILDEPQAALDEVGVIALRDLCVRWLERKSSYILISHDLHFLRLLTSRALLLDKGELLFDGSWSGVDTSPNLLSAIGLE